MKKDYSHTSYILWGMLAMSMGFGVVGIGFESTQKIFAYTTLPETPSFSSLSPTSPSIITQNISAPHQEKTDHVQKLLQETIRSNYLFANAHEVNASQTESKHTTVIEKVEESTQYIKNSCPQPEILKQPDYTKKKVDFDMQQYIPSYLIEIQNILPTKEGRSICLDSTAASYLKKMLEDAHVLGGHDIVVTSGFRDYKTQELLYKNSQKKNSNSDYLHVVRPGYSEHQLGLAVDLAGASMNYDSASSYFGDTPEGIWLQENAHLYGFDMSYPKDAEEETGVIYEPWHWRFIGPPSLVN